MAEKHILTAKWGGKKRKGGGGLGWGMRFGRSESGLPFKRVARSLTTALTFGPGLGPVRLAWGSADRSVIS